MKWHRMISSFVPYTKFREYSYSSFSLIIHHKCITKNDMIHPFLIYEPFTKPLKLYSSLSTDQNYPTERYEEMAKMAFDALAQRNRTWKRLSPIVSMACNDDLTNTNIKRIADIGCDHGLLAIALALSNKFTKTIGIDVSETALKNGGIQNLDRIINYCQLSNHHKILPSLDFRYGDGLLPLMDNEVDAICIAGMGINTIIQILCKKNESSMKKYDVHRIGCKHLFLQPTNSRPRNLIKLYDKLQQDGWILKQERIEILSSRWYISSHFVLKDDDDDNIYVRDYEYDLLPGALLNQLDPSNIMYPIYMDYIQHHRNWLKNDERKKRILSDEDKRWLSSLT